VTRIPLVRGSVAYGCAAWVARPSNSSFCDGGAG
jgi:hypothetical protein